MVNTKKLRAKIIEEGFTYERVAEYLNLSGCTFGRKVRNVSAFTLNEVEALIKLLNIPISEIAVYFLMGLEVWMNGKERLFCIQDEQLLQCSNWNDMQKKKLHFF